MSARPSRELLGEFLGVGQLPRQLSARFLCPLMEFGEFGTGGCLAVGGRFRVVEDRFGIEQSAHVVETEPGRLHPADHQ